MVTKSVVTGFLLTAEKHGKRNWNQKKPVWQQEKLYFINGSVTWTIILVNLEALTLQIVDCPNEKD